MKSNLLSVGIAILIVVVMSVLANVDALLPDQHVAGRNFIPSLLLTKGVK